MEKILWKSNSILIIICLLNETLKLHNITIIIKSIFEGDVKYYPQVFLDECLYEL